MDYKGLGLGKILIKWLQGILELLAFPSFPYNWRISNSPWDMDLDSQPCILYLVGLILGSYLLKSRDIHILLVNC